MRTFDAVALSLTLPDQNFLYMCVCVCVCVCERVRERERKGWGGVINQANVPDGLVVRTMTSQGYEITIWRSSVRIPFRSQLGCVVLLSIGKSYLKTKI